MAIASASRPQSYGTWSPATKAASAARGAIKPAQLVRDGPDSVEPANARRGDLLVSHGFSSQTQRTACP